MCKKVYENDYARDMYETRNELLNIKRSVIG